MGKSRPWFYHLPPLLFCAALAAGWTRPLFGRLATAIVGEGAGDNVAFLWDFWWARFAAADPASSLFFTDHLFAPLGTNLVLHTLIPAVSLSAAAFPGADLVTLYNLALVAAVFLNAACTYAVAWILTRDRLASTFAAVAFAGAPHLLVRLLGHLNVLSAWGLPLLLLAFLRLERKRSMPAAVCAGAALALLVYIDYYYAIFGGVLVIVYLVGARCSLTVTARPLTATRRIAAQTLAALVAVVVLVVVSIWISGGTELTVGGRPVSIRSTFNPRAAAWVLGIAALLLWKAPRVRLVRLAGTGPGIRLLAVAAGTTCLLLLPIFAAAARVLADGDYVTQRFSWRSAPGGIDLAALVLGNPLNALTGGLTKAAYTAFRIDPTEGAAWLGIAQIVLLVVAFKRLRTEPEGRRLLLAAAVFFVWALGPYLTIAGQNSALLLPQSFFKFVPILSNARIPTRALTVVLLMLALFGAMALASLPSQRRRTLGLAALAVVLLDAWPRANPVVPVERPPLYETLRSQPAGAVLEVPLGTRDSFQKRGFLDHQVLFYQTLHEHPIVGGTVSRLSPRTIRAYDEDPILGPLLDLSEGKPPAAAQANCSDSLACVVRYVVIDENLASEAARQFIGNTFSLEKLEQNGARVLYRVDGLKTCSCSKSID